MVAVLVKGPAQSHLLAVFCSATTSTPSPYPNKTTCCGTCCQLLVPTACPTAVDSLPGICRSLVDMSSSQRHVNSWYEARSVSESSRLTAYTSVHVCVSFTTLAWPGRYATTGSRLQLVMHLKHNSFVLLSILSEWRKDNIYKTTSNNDH